MSKTYVNSIKIRNYRTLSNVSFKFDSLSNVIIGENEAGKTGLVNIMRKFFDKNSSYQTNRFKSTDFSLKLINDFPENSKHYWSGHWIVATICFSFPPVDDYKDINLLEILDVTSDGKSISHGEIHCVFRPKESIRKKLYNLSTNGDFESRKEIISAYLEKITIEDYEMRYFSKTLFDLNSDEEYLKFVGDFNEYLFPNPDESVAIPLNKEKIYDLFEFTFIDYDRDKGLLVNNSPFARSIYHKLNEIKDNDESRSKLIDILNSFNSGIDSLPEISTLTDSINENMKAVIKGSYKSNFEVKSNLAEETQTLSRALSIVDGNIDSSSFSLGMLNILHISLIFLNAKLAREQAIKNGKPKSLLQILVIEEPESHLHVHLQKTLFNSLYEAEESNDYGIQVFMTTHSTHLSESTQLLRMNIINSKSTNGYRWSEVYSPRSFINDKFSMERVKRIERYLDVKRSELLFANGIVLVEGDAEQILIPTLFKKKFNITLDEIGVSLISVNSAVFDYIAELFGVERIRKNCSIITDLDIDESESDDYDESFTDSEEAEGTINFKSLTDRLQRMNDKYHDNEYVRIFVTTLRTFECDLAFCKDNSNYFKRLVDKIYVSKSACEKSKTKLDNLTTAPNEVLRIANKVGKGWFALMLSEIIDENFIIPDYIMEAILFASKEALESNAGRILSQMDSSKKELEDPNWKLMFSTLEKYI